MKEPWESRQRATPKSCRPCPTDLESFRKFQKIEANKETQLKRIHTKKVKNIEKHKDNKTSFE